MLNNKFAIILYNSLLNKPKRKLGTVSEIECVLNKYLIGLKKVL